jgi:TRAP-type mannitol/chloroaromatic compound transport system permease small subunit
LGILRAFVQTADCLSSRFGAIACWFIFPLIFALAYEITARFFFQSPTIWAYDATYMLYGSLYMLGLAYTLLIDGHVKIEFFYEKMSPRKRTVVDIAGYLLFFFPSVGVLFYFCLGFAWESWLMQERAKESIFAPPIYPLKTVMLIGIFLLLIQGTAKFIRHVASLMGRQL